VSSREKKFWLENVKTSFLHERRKKEEEKERSHSFFFFTLRSSSPARALLFCSCDRRRLSRESKGEKMLTRGQMRRMGERDLWDVIVHNDDICFKHVLPRLSQNDIKFLYDVNTETRALIKRAMTSGITLEDRFQIEEMSSISTLEFAWNNMDWEARDKNGYVMNQDWFCWKAARTNKLELLKWAREEKGCEFDINISFTAALRGNLEMLKYCVANQCPVDEDVCGSAASHGHLECLKYLHEEVKAPWDYQTGWYAAQSGHLHILEYVFERKYDKYNRDACAFTARCGKLDCLKYLHEVAKAPWGDEAVLHAYFIDCQECLRYLLDNDCPLPEGWRYEDGDLYVPESESESES